MNGIELNIFASRLGAVCDEMGAVLRGERALASSGKAGQSIETMGPGAGGGIGKEKGCRGDGEEAGNGDVVDVEA